jgi:CheY-like chemotaxis protein
MQEKIGLLYYFPTTTVLIDDNQAFLHSVSINLDASIHCRTFNDPEIALAHLKTHSEAPSFASQFLSTPSDEDIESNFAMIHQEAFNKNRFHLTTSIVVDYAMPRMNGIDFCREIKNLPLKKIMLTGEADEALAVDAFNDGIIDKFIRKGSRDTSAKLNLAIKEAQKDYFRHLSHSIVGYTKSCDLLNDETFAAFFENICEQNNISEYYAIDDGNSFLLIDSLGKTKFFIVKTADKLNEYYRAGKDDGASLYVLKCLESRKKIPFFGINKEFWTIPAQEWEKYLFDAVKCVKCEDCYYALIDNPQLDKLAGKKIFSYNDFLQE